MRVVVNDFMSLDGVVLLGGGKRIFPEHGAARPMKLAKSVTASTGVQICTYHPAE